MKITKTEVCGFDHAIRGMRNPKNSWHLSDSHFNGNQYILGEKDLHLCKTLVNAGAEHSKFMRFITVYMDVEAPLYWWKEMDTYKHVEKNSTSTMHKILDRKLTEDDFEVDQWDESWHQILHYVNIAILNKDFRKAIQLLPSAYKQTRTMVINYAQLRNMYFQRRYHKLPEWKMFCEWIESLPYSELITLAKV